MTAFTWAWNNYPAQPDPSMTRARAARLLWAWRRTSRKPTSMGRMLRSLVRVRPGTYRVVDLQSGETATITIAKEQTA
jgi:hypothetical protein